MTPLRTLLVLLVVLVPLALLAPAALAQPLGLAMEAPGVPTCADALGDARTQAAEVIPFAPVAGVVKDPCPGIRPGGALVIHMGPVDVAYCSLGFIVTDGSDLYVTTAGHCTDPAQGLGPRFSAHGVPGEFGTLVYRWCEGKDAKGEGCRVGADFALIKIDKDKRQYVTGAMCHWGAPTGGLFRPFDQVPRSVQHFGWGIALGDASANLATVGNPVTQAREGLGLDFGDPSYAFLLAAASPGDSGSGVLVMPLDLAGRAPLAAALKPQALGILTHISGGGFAFAQRLDTSLLKAGRAMDTKFTLVTA